MHARQTIRRQRTQLLLGRASARAEVLGRELRALGSARRAAGVEDRKHLARIRIPAAPKLGSPPPTPATGPPAKQPRPSAPDRRGGEPASRHLNRPTGTRSPLRSAARFSGSTVAPRSQMPCMARAKSAEPSSTATTSPGITPWRANDASIARASVSSSPQFKSRPGSASAGAVGVRHRTGRGATGARSRRGLRGGPRRAPTPSAVPWPHSRSGAAERRRAQAGAMSRGPHAGSSPGREAASCSVAARPTAESMPDVTDRSHPSGREHLSPPQPSR